MLAPMLIELAPALPLILGFWAGLWLLAIQSFSVLSLWYQVRLRPRAGWAAAHAFMPVVPSYTDFQIQAAVPGLSRPGEQLRALAAYAHDGCLVADVSVRTEHPSGRHAPGVMACQPLTVARATLAHNLPAIEVRPWSAWPADRRQVAQRDAGVGVRSGGAGRRQVTVCTDDDGFDQQFVVSAADKRAALALLTPRVRQALQACPTATFALSAAALIVTAPRLVDNMELDCMMDAIGAVRTAIAAAPYAA